MCTPSVASVSRFEIAWLSSCAGPQPLAAHLDQRDAVHGGGGGGGHDGAGLRRV